MSEQRAWRAAWTATVVLSIGGSIFGYGEFYTGKRVADKWYAEHPVIKEVPKVVEPCGFQVLEDRGGWIAVSIGCDGQTRSTPVFAPEPAHSSGGPNPFVDVPAYHAPQPSKARKPHAPVCEQGSSRNSMGDCAPDVVPAAKPINCEGIFLEGYGDQVHWAATRP